MTKPCVKSLPPEQTCSVFLNWVLREKAKSLKKLWISSPSYFELHDTLTVMYVMLYVCMCVCWVRWKWERQLEKTLRCFFPRLGIKALHCDRASFPTLFINDKHTHMFAPYWPLNTLCDFNYACMCVSDKLVIVLHSDRAERSVEKWSLFCKHTHMHCRYRVQLWPPSHKRHMDPKSNLEVIWVEKVNVCEKPSDWLQFMFIHESISASSDWTIRIRNTHFPVL